MTIGSLDDATSHTELIFVGLDKSTFLDSGSV